LVVSMEESTLAVAGDSPGVNRFNIEHTFGVTTAEWRSAVNLADFPAVVTLRSLFASVVVKEVIVECRQDTLVGASVSTLNANGHIFVAMIPSGKDTDAATGSTAAIVMAVPRKQTFGLSVDHQVNQVFHMSLSGFEADLAQDPRRNAGPDAWLGNSGVRAYAPAGGGATPIKSVCTSTWRVSVECTGATPDWL